MFLRRYRQAREVNPLLPEYPGGQQGCVLEWLEKLAGRPGVIAESADGMLAGFLLTGPRPFWKGHRAAIVPEYAHAALPEQAEEIYRAMYMRLAEKWRSEGIQLHIIGHLAHDKALQETLFQLGFGAIISEKLRDLSPLDEAEAGRDSDCSFENDTDAETLLNLQMEHNRYYFNSPIFITKDLDREAVRADVAEHRESGETFLVCRKDGIAAGYFLLGASSVDAEGFLVQNTNTAAIHSAYIKPEFRGAGLGRRMLNESLRWAQENGFDRLMVEHETANYYGGRFWNRHFESYLYFSMRYIEKT